MTSPATAKTSAQTTWQADVAERQRMLAGSLRLLASGAPLEPGSMRARSWDGVRPEATTIGELCALIDAVGAAQAILAPRALAALPRTARRINDALDRVRLETSFADILRSAPTELSASCGFDRVLISRLDRSTWLPVHWHVTADSPASTAFGEYVRDTRISLANGMIEAEIVRRRAPALVSDALAEPRTFPPLRDIARSTSYLVGPITATGAVVGLLHADTHTSGRALGEADRAQLRAFADGLGLIIERAALLERLTAQRERVSRALAAAASLVDELCAAPVQLTRSTTSTAAAAPATDHRPDDRLTPRERDVISLVASGATNAEIADQLTVSPTTVKSHVKHILRKLRAANRAEAISRYLGLDGPRQAS